MSLQKYNVTGMSCAACQARVEKAVAGVAGVDRVAVSLLTNTMGVEGDASPEAVISAVEEAGYGAKTIEREQADAFGDREVPILRRRLIASVALLIPLMYGSMGHGMLGLPLPGFLAENPVALGVGQMILAGVIMIINGRFFTSGFRSLARLSPNMDALVAIGSMASYVWSIILLIGMATGRMPDGDGGAAAAGQAAGMAGGAMHGLYFESAAMIVTLITVGKLLEAVSKGRTTDALKSLLALAPQTAVIERDGREIETPVDRVAPGDIIVVRPGDAIPVDAEILEGETAVDESALTGESIPVDKGPGDRISAATINTSGYVRARALRVGEDTTLAQIIRMVSDAAATKAPIARIADRVSAVFVPLVICIAAAVILIWLLLGAETGYALARGISVLVISCPCALGLATPVAIMAGSGVGAKNGILFKTAASLESTGRTEIVVLDKTGTITRGEPAVTDVIAAPGIGEDRLLSCALGLEVKSEHPLAKAIVAFARERSLEPAPIEGFRALPGNGLEGRLAACVREDGPADTGAEDAVIGGSLAFVSGRLPVPAEIEERCRALAAGGKTPLLFGQGGELLGVIAVADAVKGDSREAIGQLKTMGIRVVMLTGDNERTARAVGGQVDVDEVVAGVLPDRKEAVVRELQEEGYVAMVGDGINDAPALTRADTGMAIGAGTDVAVDAADVVLMNSSLMDVAAAVRLGRASLRNIHENLFWAFIYNVLLIPLAAGAYTQVMDGWTLNPMIAAAAMSLSSFCVCMNALRLNLLDVHSPARDRRIRRKASGGGGRRADALPDSGAAQTGRGPSENDTMNGPEKPAEARKERPMEKTMTIEGMMCAHCEATVKKALEALDGVKEARVSHEAGTAVVETDGQLSDEALKQAVEEKDYTVLSVE